MALKDDVEQSKHFITQALSCYAAFFAGIAEDSEEHALSSLNEISNVDNKAQEELNEKELAYYMRRRTELMRIFRTRLVDELKGQVEDEILLRAEKLVADFESA